MKNLFLLDLHLTDHDSAAFNQTEQSSEWTSETTRNLLARIKQLKDDAQRQTPSSPRSSPATDWLHTPPTSPRTLPPAPSKTSPLANTPIVPTPPSTWSARKLSATAKRDSLTSLFSSPGSMSLKSKIPKLDLKKRFKKQSPITRPESPGSPTSGSPGSRVRHIPLVGLGIEVDDPFIDSSATSSLELVCGATREDSNATLVPNRQRESTSSQSTVGSINTAPTELSTSAETTASTSRSTSLESDRLSTVPLARARSANLLSAPWSPEISLPQSPSPIATTSSSSAAGPPGFRLRRFRSLTPLASTTNTVADGIINNPSSSKAQKARFNRAFDFSKDETASTTSSDFASRFRLRRMRGYNELRNSKIARKFSGSRNDILDSRVVEETPSAIQKSPDINAQSYEEQLVNLRVQLGLPAQNSFHTGPPHLAHPHHDFAWDTKNLRCLVCPSPPTPALSTSSTPTAAPSSKDVTHLHPAMRSGFVSHDSSGTITTISTNGTSNPPLTNASSPNLLTHVHPAFRSRLNLALGATTTSRTTTIAPHAPQTCALCPSTCCLYSSLLSSPLPPNSSELTLFREIIRLTAPGTPLGRSAGRNPFSTFVKCGNGDCGKMVCPGCASRCRLVGCAEVVCKGCREREGGGWICGWHGED